MIIVCRECNLAMCSDNEDLLPNAFSEHFRAEHDPEATDTPLRLVELHGILVNVVLSPDKMDD